MKTSVTLLAVGLSVVFLGLFFCGARAEPVLPGSPSTETGPSGTCTDGRQDSGAAYRICMPYVGWNGDLVVYAHGYVAIYRPVEIPEDQMSLPGYAASVDQIINGLGYAFAATSYYTNGLAVLPALADVRDLVELFSQLHTTPTHVLIAGVSEGGLITTLAVEQFPEVFDGGLAMCGPYGDFVDQIDYLGDTRVLVDYFFPGLMPGDPVSISQELMATWETSYYSTTVLPVLEDPANAVSITQILQMLNMPPYTFDPPTSTASLERLLWYNVYATNDARNRFGGQPFDNMDRVYRGSGDDIALNAGVARFAAEPAALAEVEAHFQTTGVLTVPLVTLHTTGDALVPFWHAPIYRGKVLQADNLALHTLLEADRYGHCSFTLGEIIGAFAELADMVENPRPYRPVSRILIPLVLRTS